MHITSYDTFVHNLLIKNMRNWCVLVVVLLCSIQITIQLSIKIKLKQLMSGTINKKQNDVCDQRHITIGMAYWESARDAGYLRVLQQQHNFRRRKNYWTDPIVAKW